MQRPARFALTLLALAAGACDICGVSYRMLQLGADILATGVEGRIGILVQFPEQRGDTWEQGMVVALSAVSGSAAVPAAIRGHVTAVRFEGESGDSIFTVPMQSTGPLDLGYAKYDKTP